VGEIVEAFGANSVYIEIARHLDADEELLAQVAVGIARAGGKMFEGRLLECRVGRLLDARFPRVGISPWDLRLADETTIEVRSGTSQQRGWPFMRAFLRQRTALIWNGRQSA
jgi:hypothetical protein